MTPLEPNPRDLALAVARAEFPGVAQQVREMYGHRRAFARARWKPTIEEARGQLRWERYVAMFDALGDGRWAA